jgi:hypothetical protein
VDDEEKKKKHGASNSPLAVGLVGGGDLMLNYLSFKYLLVYRGTF